MISVYELKLSGDTLKAIKVKEELNKAEICGQDAVLFPNGKRIAAFYKLREDGYGMVFHGKVKSASILNILLRWKRRNESNGKHN